MSERFAKAIGRQRDYYNSEYHRLNIQVARVIGAQAAVDQAFDRARTVKSMPLWMLRFLESAAERLPGISADLATLRDQCCDAHIWRCDLSPAEQRANQARMEQDQ